MKMWNFSLSEPPAKVESVKNESHAGGDHQAGPSGDHQHGSGGRHVHKSNALCGGEWKYPVSCDPFDMDCTYYAKWEYLENIDQIRFTITANHTNRWLAIGFSETASMVLFSFCELFIVPSAIEDLLSRTFSLLNYF